MVFCKRSGLSCVVVVLIMSFVSILTLGWWRRASMSFDVVSSRERWYRNFYMTEEFLRRGVERALAVQKYPLECEMSAGGGSKRATFCVDRLAGGYLKVGVVLRDGDEQICSIRCLLEEGSRLKVHNYTVD